MIHVFQSKNFRETCFSFGPEKVKPALEKGVVTYDHVATVNTIDHEHAYVLTNTHENSWWEAGLTRGVTPVFEGKGCRSTSTGDIIRDCDRIFVVMAFGYEEVAGVDVNKYFKVKS